MLIKFCSLILRPKAQHFIMCVILFNAAILGIEVSVHSEEWKIFFKIADTACIIIFILEILMKLAVKRGAFFRSAWDVFDLAVTVTSVLFNYLSIFRALRIIRVLRLIAKLPKMSLILESLLTSLPGIGWITALLTLIFYMFSVISTALFGAAFPKLFGTIAASMYSAFQLLTLEGWSTEIVNPVLEEYPYALLVFIPFILIASYIMVNFFVGIIVNSMSDTAAKSEKKEEGETEQDYSGSANIKEELEVLKKELAKLERMILK
jgi:voltage-gated sodium channel